MSPWGWDPGVTVVPLPPGTVRVYPGTSLQPIVNAMTSGGTIALASGTFYADTASPTTPLSIAAAQYGLQIVGQADDYSTIGSPVLITSGKIGLQRLRVNPTATDYGVKIFLAGSFLARCWMREVIIGAVTKASAQAGNGPKDGLILDGAGLFLAEKATFAFCRRHGLVVDSTDVEPNTTLKFDMCSFVQNGFGPSETVGYGIHVQGSAGIVEFNGGNSEGNKYGEALCQNMNSLRFRDFDFETSEVMENQISILSSRPAVVDNCNFVTGASKATRGVIVQSSNQVFLVNNKFEGWTAVGVVRIDEASTECDSHQNNIPSGCWIEDYSR